MIGQDGKSLMVPNSLKVNKPGTTGEEGRVVYACKGNDILIEGKLYSSKCPVGKGTTEEIKEFQDWLDLNVKGWITSQPDGVKKDVTKGYGKCGPSTRKAWASHKNDFKLQKTVKFVPASANPNDGDDVVVPDAVAVNEDFRRLMTAKLGNSKPLVKEQEEENYDEARKDYNWFERDDIAPEDLEKVLSNNNKKYSDKEWKLNDLKKRFTSPILNANSEEEIMDAIMNMAELASYRKTQPFVNEQVRSADNEYYSDNSLSKPGRVYLKNGDKDEVDEILSNLPTDTLFLALLDCEEADFSNIDLGEFKSLLFINLKGTPNNLLRTQGDYFEHDSKGHYMTTKNI
jgi:hypothetical protein